MLDMASGAVLLFYSFCAVCAMDRRTFHRYRTIYIVLCVASLALLVSPFVDAEWRRYAHVFVITAVTFRVMLDRRRDRRTRGVRGLQPGGS